MAITPPPYLFKRGQIWYFRQRVPHYLLSDVGKKEIKVSLKTQDINDAKRRSVQVAFKLQLYFSLFEKKFMTKKNQDDAQFAQLITLGETKIGNDTIGAITLDLGDPEAEKEALKMYLSMIQKHTTQSSDIVLKNESTYNESQEKKITLSTAVNEYLTLKRDAINIHENVNEKTVGAIQAKLDRLIDILGDVAVDSLVLKDAEHFRNILLRLPPNINKAAKFRDHSIDEILAMKPEKTMSHQTVITYVQGVSTFYSWCVKNRYAPDNPFEGLKVRKPKDAKSAQEEREPWEPHQLSTIFSSPIFTDNKMLHNYYYWLPLIGLFTGARMNEICQLYVEDIIKEDEIWAFSLTNLGEHQSTKNDNSRRIVPIHSKLIELGFLNFYEQIKKSDRKMLFTGLSKGRDNFSKNASSWFKRYREKHNLQINGKKQDFYSFRHNVSDYFKQYTNAREVDVAAILGHLNQMITFNRYGRAVELKRLMSIVEQLNFDEALKNVKPWKFKS